MEALPKQQNPSNTKKTNLNLSKQQNPTQNSLSVRPANTLNTSVSKPWWQFWGGKHRKLHRKTRHYTPSSSRGGNPYIGMDEASIQRNIKEMQQTYGSKSEKEKTILAGKIKNAQNALNVYLQNEHNALEKAGYGTSGGRKSQRKPKRRGSRKTLRK